MVIIIIIIFYLATKEYMDVDGEKKLSLIGTSTMTQSFFLG
jgi:hypothetical protein